MSVLFDDVDGKFLVLVNEENQHSLWPAAVDVPAGWRIARGEGTRQDSLDYVEKHWTDMRPASLIAVDEFAVAAASPAERLADLFAGLLERDSVGIQEDFFELGGHSLLATRLVNRIKEEFQVEVPLQTLFENPTPGELADRLASARPARAALQARPRPGSSAS